MDETMRKRLARQISGIDQPRQPDDAVFAAGLEEVAAFAAEQHRMPEASARDPRESRLGRWLDVQRATEAAGDLCQVRRGMLVDALGPGWRGER